MPEIRTQHAASVERKTRKQIEDSEEEVDVVKILHHLYQHAVRKSPDQDRQRDEDSPKRHTGQRACNSRIEFGAWAARLHLRHLRYAPEDEKRDLAYRNSQTPRDEAMTQFMQENAAEESE